MPWGYRVESGRLVEHPGPRARRIFVCSDARLAEVIALIPNPDARPITMVDFAATRLAATGSGR